MRFAVIALLAVGIFAYFYVTRSDEPANIPVATAEIQTDPAIAVFRTLPSCEIGTPVGDVFGVNETFQVRAAPRMDAASLINEKATEALRKTHYHVVDNSTSVRRFCEHDDWTLVAIAQPSWLSHVKGWVPSTILRKIERTETGKRIYTEADFLWDSSSQPFAAKIVAVVNKISVENSSCNTLDPTSMALSPSRSVPNDPVFFVTCGSGARAFNVWFRPSDTDDTVTMAGIAPLAKDPAILACREAAMEAAVNPTTVNFSAMTSDYDAHPSGRVSVASSFTAKNALGHEIKFNIRCLFEGSRIIDSPIWQVGT